MLQSPHHRSGQAKLAVPNEEVALSADAKAAVNSASRQKTP
jgi:hypothetical protein